MNTYVRELFARAVRGATRLRLRHALVAVAMLFNLVPLTEAAVAHAAPLAAVSNPPANGHSIIVFPQRDFVSADGYADDDLVVVYVIEPDGTTWSTDPANPISPQGGLVEVNHPGGACWFGTTPDIRPGDTVQIDIVGGPNAGIADATTVMNITAKRPVQTAPDTVVVHGTAQDSFTAIPGNPLPIAEIEHRIVAPGNLFDLNGRRTLRATPVAGADGTLAYDAPGSINWTATYSGLSPADVTAGARCRIAWHVARSRCRSGARDHGLRDRCAHRRWARRTVHRTARSPPAAPGQRTDPAEHAHEPHRDVRRHQQRDAQLGRLDRQRRRHRLRHLPQRRGRLHRLEPGWFRSGADHLRGAQPAARHATASRFARSTRSATARACRTSPVRSPRCSESTSTTSRSMTRRCCRSTSSPSPRATSSRRAATRTATLVSVQVLRRNSAGQFVVVSSADGIQPIDGFAEVNHPGGACWAGVTPEMRTGDIVRTIAYNPANVTAVNPDGIRSIDQTTIAGVTAFQPVVVANDDPNTAENEGVVEIHGTALGADGQPLPIDQIEQRMIATHGVGLWDFNGRRALRAAANSDGTLTYDTVNNPMGVNWTATYSGLDAADVARMADADTRAHWLGRNPLAAQRGDHLRERAGHQPPRPGWSRVARDRSRRPTSRLPRRQATSRSSRPASTRSPSAGLRRPTTGTSPATASSSTASASPTPARGNQLRACTAAPGPHTYAVAAFDTASPRGPGADIITQIVVGLRQPLRQPVGSVDDGDP